MSASPSPSLSSEYEIMLTYKGTSKVISVTTTTTGNQLHRQTMEVFGFINDNNNDDDDDIIDIDSIKLLYKGKRIQASDDVFPFVDFTSTTTTKKFPKIIVMATNTTTKQELAQKRSDPLIRGFDDEKRKQEHKSASTSTTSTLGGWYGPK